MFWGVVADNSNKLAAKGFDTKKSIAEIIPPMDKAIKMRLNIPAIFANFTCLLESINPVENRVRKVMVDTENKSAKIRMNIGNELEAESMFIAESFTINSTMNFEKISNLDSLAPKIPLTVETI